MSTSTPSPAAKALAYAENELKVHTVYQEALEARGKLDKTLTDLGEVRDKKRDVEARLSDAELEIASDERGKHPDMSQAQMDKHLKVALHNSTEVRELREQLIQVVNDADGLEFDKAMHETDIKIAVARLTELGGYLNYLAAIKTQAGYARETPREESSP